MAGGTGKETETSPSHSSKDLLLNHLHLVTVPDMMFFAIRKPAKDLSPNLACQAERSLCGPCGLGQWQIDPSVLTGQPAKATPVR